MAYKKRNFKPRRKQQRKKKAPASGWATAWKTAKTLAPYIAPMLGLNAEHKQKVTSIGSTGVAYNNVHYTDLSAISEGDDNSQRNGTSIRLYKLTGNVLINGNTAGSNDQKIRFIIFRWDDDTTPTVSSVLTGIAGNSLDFMRSYNSDELKMKVIHDQIVNVSPNAGNPNVSHIYRISYKLDHHIKYSGSDNTDGTYGRLYIMALSNTANASNPPYIEYLFNTYFLDN